MIDTQGNIVKEFNFGGSVTVDQQLINKNTDYNFGTSPIELEDMIKQLQKMIRIDRFMFEKNLQLLDGKNLQLGKSSGTKIGTESTQKIGFFNATPVSQQLKANHNNWVALSDVVSALVNLGLLDQI